MTQDNREMLLELAAKVEGMSEGESSVEKEVALAMGWTHHVEQHEDDMRDDVWTDPNGKRHAWYPFCLRSLDAAMTLIEAPTWWWVEAQPLVQGSFLAGCGDERVSKGATPALALTAAALRAHAAQGEARQPSPKDALRDDLDDSDDDDLEAWLGDRS